MINNFAGSPLSGNVFIRGHPMIQIIFTLTRWVHYAYTAKIYFGCMISDFTDRPVTAAVFYSRTHKLLEDLKKCAGGWAFTIKITRYSYQIFTNTLCKKSRTDSQFWKLLKNWVGGHLIQNSHSSQAKIY